jgi:hypothetical protein
LWKRLNSGFKQWGTSPKLNQKKIYVRIIPAAVFIPGKFNSREKMKVSSGLKKAK